MLNSSQNSAIKAFKGGSQNAHMATSNMAVAMVGDGHQLQANQLQRRQAGPGSAVAGYANGTTRSNQSTTANKHRQDMNTNAQAGAASGQGQVDQSHLTPGSQI